MKTLLAIVLSAGLTQLGAQQREGREVPPVTFSHLEHLTEKILFLGDSVSIVHVYSNYPDYRWADAGDEGIACVDDAARAAVVYLRHYELTQDAGSLSRAQSLLKFVMKMETPDGMFYNFILPDHSINTGGRTSFPSFGWWAARGVWCMSLGYWLMKDSDTSFARALKAGVERTFPHIDSLLERYGRYAAASASRVPAWLLYGSGADATSELLLGLNEYYAATGETRVKLFVRRLAEGLTIMQDGDVRTFPYGLHRSWETMWHMWGNGQTQALASASSALRGKNMIKSAEKEAIGWYTRLLIQGFVKEIDLAHPEKKQDYEQIAYAVRPMAVGLLRLYEAKKDVNYLKMAGLAASWLFGNNIQHQQMYDPRTGRCFDGLTDSVTLNRNSGAESTIEALYTLLELEKYPLAMSYLTYRKVKADSTSRYLYAVFRGPLDRELTLAVDLKKRAVILLEGKKSLAFQLGRTVP